MASTDARPVPIKNTAFRAVFPILDADGDLVTGATGLDSEVSKDQGTFADCTNEATEIATSSGMYYLDLTSTEMNADCVAVIVKTSTSGAKTTVLVFYPVEAGDIDVDVTAWNGTAIPGVDTAGYPKVTIKSGTGTGEAKLSSGVVDANVTKNAGTNITAASGRQEVNVSHWKGTAAATVDTAGYPKVTVKAGSGTGELDVTSGVVKANLAQILGTALTETAGQIAAAFKKVFDVAAPVFTATSVNQTGDSYARLGAPAGASVSADVAAVKSDTAAVLDDTGTSGVVVAAASKTGYRLSSTGVQDIWDALTSALTTASSIGKLLVDNINATISSRLASSSYTAPLDAAGTRSAVGLASANLDTQLTAIDDYIDTEVAAIKAKTDLIPASPAATSDIPSAATIADAVWDEALSGHTTAGSGGKALSDIDTHTDTEIAAIKAKTDNLPSDPADQSAVEAAISAAQAAVQADISGLNDLSAAAVNAEVDTALADYDAPTRAEATSDKDAILAVLGALADAAADGDPTTGDTLMQYVKQIVNVLTGSAGIVSFPSSATPGNAVSLAEVIRQIYDEVAGLNGGSLIAASDVWAVATRTLTAIDEDSTTLDLDATIRAAVGLASANLDTQIGDLPTNAELATALASADDATLAAIAALVIPTAAQVADALLGRNIAGGSSSGRTVTEALRALRNRVKNNGDGTATVYAEDDSTPSWTAAITTDGAAEPITEVDPS